MKSTQEYRIKHNRRGYRIQRRSGFIWQNCDYHAWGFEVTYFRAEEEAKLRLLEIKDNK